eukprot:COSAG06_NODE_54805_length_292_cov_3.113990_1_plen_48_part_10
MTQRRIFVVSDPLSNARRPKQKTAHRTAKRQALFSLLHPLARCVCHIM